MTVQEIFALRRAGKIEEAYEAIRPMYAVHKGKYTTLCMFWTARDIFNKRLLENRTEEATKIYQALQRVFPNIEDPDGHAAAFMDYAARRLASPASFSSLHSSGESAPVSVPSGSPSLPGVLRDSVAEACSPPAKTSTVPAGSPAGLNPGQQAVFDCIRSHPGLRVPGLETETGIPAKSIERHIKVLIERNLIEHRGSKKTGGYHAL